MSTYYPCDSGHVPRPDGKAPAYAHCIKFQEATTAADARSLYADKYGRTKAELIEYEAQKNKFKRGTASDVAERRFTEGFDGKDAIRQHQRLLITQALIEKNVLSRALEDTTADHRRIPDFMHTDAVLATAMSAAMSAMEAAVIRQLPAGTAASTVKIELSKMCAGLAENSDKQVLAVAITDKQSDIANIQSTIQEHQVQLKSLDVLVAEVTEAWGGYTNFLHAGGDPAKNIHHWKGFASELAVAAAAAAAGAVLPHSIIAPGESSAPPEKRQKVDDALQVTAVPRPVEQMLKAIDMKIADPGQTKSNTLSPTGNEDRTEFAVRMTWLTNQMGKASFKKDNNGATGTDDEMNYINHKGFSAMVPWLNLDDMEAKRFYRSANH